MTFSLTTYSCLYVCFFFFSPYCLIFPKLNINFHSYVSDKALTVYQTSHRSLTHAPVYLPSGNLILVLQRLWEVPLIGTKSDFFPNVTLFPSPLKTSQFLHPCGVKSLSVHTLETSGIDYCNSLLWFSSEVHPCHSLSCLKMHLFKRAYLLLMSSTFLYVNLFYWFDIFFFFYTYVFNSSA